MDIEVLYEDDALVAVNKPAGVLVHETQTSGEEETIADWFAAEYTGVEGVGEPHMLPGGRLVARPGIVHRLDKDTSGVMVLAKNTQAHAALKEQFMNREVKKIYTALVYGSPRFEELTIDRPIQKHRKDFRRNTSLEGRGEMREAVTHVFVEDRFEKHTLLRVEPKTGRTHQIRVHLSDEGYPIVCDPLYGRGRECPASLGRQALHARSLAVVSPATGERMTIEAPLFADMATTIDNLRGA